MDTNLSKQLHFLVNDNTGVKLERVVEQILESNLYNIGDIVKHNNIASVYFY